MIKKKTNLSPNLYTKRASLNPKSTGILSDQENPTSLHSRIQLIRRTTEWISHNSYFSQ